MELSGKLEMVLENIDFFVPNAVKLEITEMSGYNDAEGNAAKKILGFMKNKKIRLKKVLTEKNAKNLIDKNIDLGESECFVLAVQENIKTVLMDDVSAAYHLNGLAKSKNISIKISAAAIMELIKLEKLTKKQCKETLEKMIKNRQWEKGVLEHMIKKYLQEPDLQK